MSFVFAEPNSLTEVFYQKLKNHPKRIVFSEGNDPRVVRVAAEMTRLEIGVPILLGKREKIEKVAQEENFNLQFVGIIEPEKSTDLALFCEYYERAEAARGNRVAMVKETVSKPQNFAAMMIQYGHADGMVAGNAASSFSVFRSAIQMIKPVTDAAHVFSAVVMYGEHLQHFGSSNMLVLADTGVIAEPSVDELAFIATETGKLARHIMGRPPRIAMLSHSTKGSTPSESALKMQAATVAAQKIIDQDCLEMTIDGEIQADVALDAESAEVHLQTQEKLDPADVLIFPNVDAANISMKLLQHVAGATKYGGALLGLTRPVVNISRVASEDTILRAATMVGIEAVKFNEMHLSSSL